jgi:CubicO group peptidase (beta-lactamase class C family)
MRLRHACTTTLLALLALPALAKQPASTPLPTAAPAEVGMSAERLQRIDRLLRESTDDRGYLGGVVLVARDGRIVDFEAYGHEDLARTRPMRRDAIFRMYSMTKPIASVAVLSLLEEGRLGLDDPLSRYLPEFAAIQVVDGGSIDAPRLRKPARPITLRHLLTHTAGFAAGLAGDDIAGALRDRADPHEARDLADYALRASRLPLAADPGTRFGYEGANTELLARVVEVVSGQRFGDFLQQRIFAPLGMRDTGFEVPAAQRHRVVDITTMGEDGRLRIADGPSARTPGARLNAYDSGAGGLYSTAADYARFCQMLLADGTLDGVTVLGRKTVELMRGNHLAGMLDPPVNQYSDAEGFGLGGFVVLDPVRRGQPGSAGTFGWAGAASTNFIIDPQERLQAILLLQHLPRGERPDDLPRIGRRVQTLVYGALLP